MTAYANLKALTITAGEQTAVAGLNMDGADAKGLLTSALADLNAAYTKLNFIQTNMGATSNQTAINAYITAGLT